MKSIKLLLSGCSLGALFAIIPFLLSFTSPSHSGTLRLIAFLAFIMGIAVFLLFEHAVTSEQKSKHVKYTSNRHF
jgi:hypothetical protein